MKICIACSAGGHLIEISQILPAIKNQEIFFIVADRMQARELLKNKKAYFLPDTGRNLFKLLKNFIFSFFILAKEKPRVIISTGAAFALPIIFLGKLFGSKIIFIESLAAVYKPSFSGRIVYPLANLFIIQWKNLLKFYKKAVYGGQLI